MSDRSGVGAPTHDGAEPGSSGSGGPADDAPAWREPEARAAPSTARPKRRLGADLLGAVLGGEAATPAGTPPGVPTGPERDEGRDDHDPPRDAAAAEVDAAAPRARRSTTARDDATAAVPVAAAAPTPVRAEPVVAEVAPAEPEVRGRAPRRGGALRARQVHRIIRRVDPWSVLKLSLVFYFCVWLMVVISGVLIWGLAVGSGSVESLEDFIAKLLAFEEFHFNADQIFRLFAVGGLIMVFLATAVSAILAVLFNLISDLIGGVRVTVIEEETTRRIVRRS